MATYCNCNCTITTRANPLFPFFPVCHHYIALYYYQASVGTVQYSTSPSLLCLNKPKLSVEQFKLYPSNY